MSNLSTLVRVLVLGMAFGGCAADLEFSEEFVADDATAFRLSGLSLLDPHAFVYATRHYGCQDVTARAPRGAQGVNQKIQGRLNARRGNLLANSSVVALLPHFDPGSGTADVSIVSARCSAGQKRSCTPEEGGMHVTVPAKLSETACQAVLPNTTGRYRTGPKPPEGPCLEAGPFDIPIHYFLGLKGSLTDTYLTGQYQDGQLKGGLVRGFLSFDEAQKERMFLHEQIGSKTVGDLLPSGRGNCPPGNDLDHGPDRKVGWYMYLDFAAENVDYDPQLGTSP